jgi:hypothetical protein
VNTQRVEEDEGIVDEVSRAEQESLKNEGIDLKASGR